MTNAQLTGLLAIVSKRRKGKVIYETPIVACRPFVKRHQYLLKHALKRPSGMVDLRELMNTTTIVSDLDDLLEMGFTCFDDLNTGQALWSHEIGDDHAITILIGLVDGEVEHAAATERQTSLNHAINQGRARHGRISKGR
jgi:hypothetical protein